MSWFKTACWGANAFVARSDETETDRVGSGIVVRIGKANMSGGGGGRVGRSGEKSMKSMLV